MTIYTYSYGITSSFPNQIYAESSLYSEIQNSAITSGIHSIDADFTYVYFNFKAALSPGEITVLNNIVATHNGAELAPQVIVEQGISGSIPWNIKLIQTQTTQSITGTVNIGNLPALQSVSVSNPVNAVTVLNPVSSVTVAQQTGSVFTVSVSNPVYSVAINNFPATQTVTVSNPVIVDQGQPGLSPWLITGSITTVQQSGTTAVTIDSNYETYSALALSVAVSLNKSMFSILNNSANRVIKISSIKIINSQITTVNGVICQFQILRISGHSAGTVIIPQTFDTNDVLDNNVTVRTGATISGEAATPLLRYYWSGDEWGAASSKIEGTDHSAQTMSSVYSRKINEKPITLRTGEGLTVKQLTNTTVGTFDFEIIFTEE